MSRERPGRYSLVEFLLEAPVGPFDLLALRHDGLHAVLQQPYTFLQERLHGGGAAARASQSVGVGELCDKTRYDTRRTAVSACTAADGARPVYKYGLGPGPTVCEVRPLHGGPRRLAGRAHVRFYGFGCVDGKGPIAKGVCAPRVRGVVKTEFQVSGGREPYV